MSSRKRGYMNPKLHMDRQPTIARITDPSNPAGKRREIDNVMKKARANTNDYWDKKLIEAEEKDPNRWRHTGYKKMYIQGESSSAESDREAGGYKQYNAVGVGYPPPNPRYPGNMDGRSRSRSRSRFASPPSPHAMRRRSPPHGGMVDNLGRRMSPSSSHEVGPHRGRPRSPPSRGIPPRSPSEMVARRGMGVRPRSPPEPLGMRGRKSRSPMSARHRSPPPGVGSHRRSPPPNSAGMLPNKRNQILPRSKRPPSPPPRNSCRSHSNSSMSSCSDDSCSVCSPKRPRSRSHSHLAGGPRSPHSKSSRAMHYRDGPSHSGHGASTSSRGHGRPMSPTAIRAMEKYRSEEKLRRDETRERSSACSTSDVGQLKLPRGNSRHSPSIDARPKNRPPEPPEPSSSSDFANAASQKSKKKKEKEVRPRIKIEGEKHSKRANSSSDSEDSGGSDSESSMPTFTATTRLTLSDRFGKMAQWSIDRSNMENMRITKDSSGGALKVMIAEGLETPPRRFSYSPAPAGHYPEELATVAPTGLISWDDVRVRYEYYKSSGYLRDLDLKDYIKWEEWWYKCQEWLKQERYYEYWERQQLARRRRKKLPITQRLN